MKSISTYLFLVLSILGSCAVAWAGYAMLQGHFAYGYFAIAYCLVSLLLLLLIFIIKHPRILHLSAITGIFFLISFTATSFDNGMMDSMEWFGILVVSAIVFFNWRAAKAIYNANTA